MACGAERPPLRDYGWECTGSGLIVVLRANLFGERRFPVVLPARALDVIEPDAWWDLPVTRFDGGDHAHLVVPRRPPTRPFVSNGVALDDRVRLAYPISTGTFQYEEI